MHVAHILADSNDSELDLQGLPWHLIASDLKTHFNMDMSDDKVKFSWKGPGMESKSFIKYID
jgi:hypothetical protein